MATVASLLVRVGADISGFQRGMNEASTSLQAAGNRFKDIGGKMSSYITLPLAAAGAAAFKFGADAAESASKFATVFGPATEEVAKWITDLRKTVPATTAQLQDMTSGIQDLLVPLGLTPGAAQAMTQQVTLLAADLASFNNIPIAEALERIRSGMVGQYEPLLKFGTALNAASVEAKAVELGLISEGEALDAASRAQAVFQLTLEANTKAQGDAARTADSAANSMKFLKSNLSEAAATIGNQLIPVITPLIIGLADMLKRVSEANPAVLKWGVIIGGVAAALGPLLVGLGTLLTLAPQIGAAVTFMTGPWGLAIAAAAALAIAVVTHWDEIKAFTRSTVDAVVGFFRNLKDSVTGFVTNMIRVIEDALIGRLRAVRDAVRNSIDAVTGFFKGMYDKVAGRSYVPDMMDIVAYELGPRMNAVASSVQVSTGGVLVSFEDMSRTGALEVRGMADTVETEGGRMQSIMEAIGLEAGTNLPTAFATLKDKVVGSLQSLGESLKTDFFATIKEVFKNWINEFEAIYTIVKSIINKIKEIVGGGSQQFNIGGFNPIGGGGSGGGVPGPILNIGPSIVFNTQGTTDAVVALHETVTSILDVIQNGVIAAINALSSVSGPVPVVSDTTRRSSITIENVVRVDRVEITSESGNPELIYKGFRDQLLQRVRAGSPEAQALAELLPA